jgi:hypothetical protein
LTVPPFVMSERGRPKVEAVINEINRKTSDGSQAAPVPDILGMNFQEASVGQKLPVGGYADATGTPSPLLAGAIAHVDASLSRFVKALKADHLLDSTLIIVSAKRGQSPIDPSKLAMEPGGHGNNTVVDPLVHQLSRPERRPGLCSLRESERRQLARGEGPFPDR